MSRKHVALLMVLMLSAGIEQSSAQPIEDQRVDPLVLDRLRVDYQVPVIVRVSGGPREIREAWQQARRMIHGNHGELHARPRSNGSFFAEVNRFGLIILLNALEVEEIYLPFEMTVPGLDRVDCTSAVEGDVDGVCRR